MKRITDQQAYEAQELLDSANSAQDGPIDHQPPTTRRVAEALRILRAYEAQKALESHA